MFRCEGAVSLGSTPRGLLKQRSTKSNFFQSSSPGQKHAAEEKITSDPHDRAAPLRSKKTESGDDKSELIVGRWKK